MNAFRLPLALSLAAHAIVLLVLVLLPIPAPLLTPAPPPAGIEVTFAPSLPRAAEPPTPQPVKAEPPPPQPPPPQPPVPEPPPAPQVQIPKPPPAIEPPPPAPEAMVEVPEPLPLPPPPKPRVPPLRRPMVRHVERRPPATAAASAAPAVLAAPVIPAAPVVQQAALPPARISAPVPSAQVSRSYEALLGAWLNSHKQYPESARERGEQGRAVLRFAVDRSGRVEQFAVVQSSGYPDLDAAIDEMMRGAILPAFPADMPQPRIEVSVTIRFSLE